MNPRLLVIKEPSFQVAYDPPIGRPIGVRFSEGPKPMNEEPKFTVNHRKSNPGLHMLYVTWAAKHLTVIDSMIHRLRDMGNLNLLDMISAMNKERLKLIETNAAYYDADEILRTIDSVKE